MLHVLIPAKGNSTRIPKKNLVMLGNKPLICWTLDAMRFWPDEVHPIIVTDNQEIANIATNYHCEIFQFTTEALEKYTINGYLWSEIARKFEGTHALMQITSPFRLKSDFEKIWAAYQTNRFDLVVSCNEVKFFLMDEHGIQCSIAETELLSQECTIRYTPNGAFYISNHQYLSKLKHVFEGKLGAVATSPISALDLDTMDDLNIARETIEWYKTNADS